MNPGPGSPWRISALIALLAGGCSDPEFPQCRPVPEGCEIGSEGCPCTHGGGCDPGLDCVHARCEATAPASPASMSTTGDPDTTGPADMDTGGAPDLPDCKPPVYWRSS
jgi:hypothetical protein